MQLRCDTRWVHGRTIGSRARLLTIGLVVMAAMLTGCTAGSTPTTMPPASPAPTTASSPPSAGPASVRFGKTYRLPDGLSITIGKPKRFWPSGWVRTVNSFSHYVQLKVTIRNGTAARFDVSRLAITARSGGKDADGVHDPGKLGGSPPRSVATGRAVTYRIAFGVRKPADVTIAVVARPGLAPVRVTR